jgi:quercetin dioxygenase-like cupin family protein
MNQNIEETIEAKILAEQVQIDVKKIQGEQVFVSENFKCHLMALSKMQHIPMHSTPTDAFLLGLEGRAILTIGEKLFEVTPGIYVPLPKEIPHAIKAVTDFKMLLTR